MGLVESCIGIIFRRLGILTLKLVLEPSVNRFRRREDDAPTKGGAGGFTDFQDMQ